MKTLSTDQIYIPMVCHELMLEPARGAQGIFCLDDGILRAGVIFENYNTVSIHSHIWIDDNFMPSREWFAAICDYPFNRLNVYKVIGRVAGSNKNAQRFDEKMGFIEEARIKDYSPDGDLIIYSAIRERCRILNSPVWQNYVKLVAG